MRQMDLNNLRILVEVVKHESFSRAAQVLNLPSSNVSRRVLQLEQTLGVTLLHRTTRLVKPTEEGKTVVRLASGLLESQRSIQEWQLAQSQVPSGRLTVTAPESFAQWQLGPWLIEFQQQYPNVSVNLITESQNLSFDDYDLDFAFRLGPLKSSSLIAKPLMKITFGYFASKAFIKTHGEPKNVEALLQMPAIGCMANQMILPWSFKKKRNEIEHQPNSVFSVKDQGLALKAVEAGLGVGFLPQAIVDESPKRSQLKPLLESVWPKPLQMYLVYRDKQRVSTARHQAFMSFIKNVVADS